MLSLEPGLFFKHGRIEIVVKCRRRFDLIKVCFALTCMAIVVYGIGRLNVRNLGLKSKADCASTGLISFWAD